jgi:hypothetical protein
MGRLRDIESCLHQSIIRRLAAAGVPLDGLYCLDCGAMVTRGAGKGKDTEWKVVGPVMDPTALADLRSRLGWEKDPPSSIRLAEDAPGYAAIKEGPEE